MSLLLVILQLIKLLKSLHQRVYDITVVSVIMVDKTIHWQYYLLTLLYRIIV